MVTGYKTALPRKRPSVPMLWLYKHGYLYPKAILTKNLDYGCGKGRDAEYFGADKYDPHYFPVKPTRKYDVITCNYVLNVVEPNSVKSIVKNILNLLAKDGTAFIAVRRDLPKEGKKGRGCFQHYVELPFSLVHETPSFAIYQLFPIDKNKLEMV